MEINEFIDAYSDDQIYLEMIERLVNEHPVEANVPEKIKYSSFARLWVVMMVGSIESMITEWSKDEPLMKDIGSYLDRGKNDDRIEQLSASLKLRGLNVDEEVFRDYLAIKYIRNAYVHGDWKYPKQKEYVVKCGFPGSCNEFSKENFERFKECFYHILKCLSFAKLQCTSIKNMTANH